MTTLEVLFNPTGKVYTYECKPYKGYSELSNAIDLMIKLMQEKKALSVKVLYDEKMFRKALRVNEDSYECEIYNTQGKLIRKAAIKYDTTKEHL